MIMKVPNIQGFKVYVSYQDMTIHRIFTVKQRNMRTDITRYFLYEYDSEKRNYELSHYGGSLYFTGEGFVFSVRGNYYFYIPPERIDKRFGIIEQVETIDFIEYRKGVQRFKTLKRKGEIEYEGDSYEIKNYYKNAILPK